MLFKKISLLIASLLPLVSYAQNFTLNGYITDQQNGEKIIGATIYLPQHKQGVVSNAYGFYSITLPKDSVEIEFSFIGFAKERKKIFLDKNIRLDIELTPNTLLEEVEIVAQNSAQTESSSTYTIPVSKLRQLPVLMSESDIMKSLQFLAGVSGGTEGTAGLYVRGGTPDQNLILLDGATIYNASHLFGFLSVFNSDALNQVKLIKGGIPARYGERLSSVLDISMKEGNLKKWGGSLSISPILGSLSLEAPLKKDKSSFIISMRRSWIDVLTNLFGNGDMGYRLWDLNAKINTKINEKNRLYLSLYTGRDAVLGEYQTANVKTDYQMAWGNTTAVLRWNSILSRKTFANIGFHYSQYQYLQQAETQQKNAFYFSKISSNIKEFALKTDFDIEINPKNALKIGSKTAILHFNPEIVEAESPESKLNFESPQTTSTLAQEFYVENEFSFYQNWKLNAGLRYSGFLVQSQYYQNPQARLILNMPLKDWNFHVSYTNMVQYVHLLTGASITLPTDLWVSSTKNVRPQTSNQISMGFSKNVFRNHFSLQADVYYKNMENLIEYKEGTSFLYQSASDWEQKVVVGKGNAYGLELFLNKNKGKLTGWISYTLSWANRTFAALNQGKEFPFKYDRRHNLSVVLNWQARANRNLSLAFVFNSGTAFTFLEGTYKGANPLGINYDLSFRHDVQQRSNMRMPAYHRLDFSYQTNKVHQKYKRTWIFSVYNLYNRLNAFSIFTDKDKLYQFTLFPIFPSLAYRVDF